MAANLADAARRLKPRGAGGHLPVLMVMTDSHRLADPSAFLPTLPRGTAIVLRHPDRHVRAELAARLAPACRHGRLRLLIAGDARLAVAVGAAGVHLPEAMVRAGRAEWRRWRRPGWLVTAAAHSAPALRRAERLGVDAVVLAPVFPTASHPGAKPLGPLAFVRLARAASIPAYALGGITALTARRLHGSGAAGFAAVGAWRQDAVSVPSS